MRFGELSAEVAGFDPHGSPVVLLHGLTFDCNMWAPLINVLKGRRVLAFDLPGHGRSPLRYSYEPGELAALLHDALLAAGVQKPVLVGHSIGGLLATAYAGAYPSRAVLNIDQPLLPGMFGQYLRSVESVLRGPDYLSIWASLFAGMDADRLAPELRDLLHSRPRQDVLLGYWREILQESPLTLCRQRTRELTALRTAGTAYHYISRAAVNPGYAEWLRSTLPEVVMTVLPDSGHFPHLAQPEKVARILTDWK